jgi:hypothetical protein
MLHAHDLSAVSRRQALTLAAGAGVAAAAVATLGGSAVADVPVAARAATREATGLAEDALPIVVRLRDVASGTLELFVGAKRVEFRDAALAAVIANAGRS